MPFGGPRRPRHHYPMDLYPDMNPRVPPHPRAARNMMQPQGSSVNYELAQAVNDLARQPGNPLHDAILAGGVHPDQAWMLVRAEMRMCHAQGIHSPWDAMLEMLEARISHMEGEDGMFGGFDNLHAGHRAGFHRPPRGFPGAQGPRGPRGPAFRPHGVFDDPFAGVGHHGPHHDGGWGHGHGHHRFERAPSRSGSETASDLAQRQQRARAERRSEAEERDFRRQQANAQMGMGGFF